MTDPWTTEQLEALWGSAEHWLANWQNPKTATIGVENCPCCNLYWNSLCEGCPIFLHTGIDSCDETPYREATTDINNTINYGYTYRYNIEAEYRFLVELALGERGPK